MIDTHSHIDAEEFRDDIAEVVIRAREAGVEKVLIPNINLDTVKAVMTLCKRYPGLLHPMIGLHPEDVNPQNIDIEKTLGQMEQILADNLQGQHPYVAVGEVGIDLYWDQTYKDEQIDVFERQVDWAKKYGLPLMIHCRNAHRELVESLRKHDADGLSGVFHCFAGTEEEAAELLEFKGFKLGVGGVLTFRKSTLPIVLKKIVPLERIVLETDAPYLAPVPFRGKRNEPAYVRETAKRLAIIYECTFEHLEEVTTNNAKSVFRKI